MLRRKIYERLVAWKNSMPDKALLVDGARQVGKSFIIEEFANREFDEYVKVDFLRDEQAPFVSESKDVLDLINRLSLLAGHRVSPGSTLVFFDEVQEAQNLVTLSKYLVQDGRFRLVMSGSLLGTELRHVRSFPVGSLHIESMYPLDFEEFCWSQGATERLLRSLAEHYENLIPIEGSLHERMTRLFRLYIVIGGMPAAVQRYLDTSGDLGAVRDVQRDLVQLYRADITKYAGRRALQVMSIFDDVPSQLAKENKRFELKSLRKKATYERFANDFQWLVASRACIKVVNVTEPKSPLRRTEEPNRFKLYLCDTGMLVSRYPMTAAMSIIAGDKGVNCGGVYENVVAQELAAARVVPRYHRHSGRGEVDFIGETPQSEVLPIEVKSGKDYKRHVALNNLLSTDEYCAKEGVVLSEANISTERRVGKLVRYLPMYLIPFLSKELVSEEVGAKEELERMGMSAKGLVVPPPDFSDFA